MSIFHLVAVRKRRECDLLIQSQLLRHMKHIASVTALLIVSALHFNAAEPPNAQDQQLLALVKEIQAQSAKMAENQAAIEAKLASIAEAVRVGRINASRAGG